MNERENKSRKLNGENEGSSLIEPESSSNENEPSNTSNEHQGSSLIEPESFPNEIDPVDMSDQIYSRAIVPSNDQRALNSAEMEVDQGNLATILRGIIFSAA